MKEASVRTNKESLRIGFIGLGVMGEPICRNIAQKASATVVAFDLREEPLQAIAKFGVVSGKNVIDTVADSKYIFMSLPSGEAVKELVETSGLIEAVKPGQMVVDLSTSNVQCTRELASRLAELGVTWVDAPVARTRSAAERGELAVMVGADEASYHDVLPLIQCFATDVIHCGPVGCGQVVKIMNNYLLFEQLIAIAEAKIIAERSGVSPEIFFEAMSKGSADSFALRNHGMKAILPNNYPKRAFSVSYAQKDLRYGLKLADEAGIEARWAKDVNELFDKAILKGNGDDYWPVVSQLL